MKLAILATVATGAAAFAPTTQVTVSIFERDVIFFLSTVCWTQRDFLMKIMHSDPPPWMPAKSLPSFNMFHASLPTIFLSLGLPPLELLGALQSALPLTLRELSMLSEISAPQWTNPFHLVRLTKTEPSQILFLEQSSILRPVKLGNGAHQVLENLLEVFLTQSEFLSTLSRLRARLSRFRLMLTTRPTSKRNTGQVFLMPRVNPMGSTIRRCFIGPTMTYRNTNLLLSSLNFAPEISPGVLL